MLDTPCLFVFEPVLAESCSMGRVLGGDPEEDVSVVAGAGQDLS